MFSGSESEEAFNTQQFILLKGIHELSNNRCDYKLEVRFKTFHLSFSGCLGTIQVNTFH